MPDVKFQSDSAGVSAGAVASARARCNRVRQWLFCTACGRASGGARGAGGTSAGVVFVRKPGEPGRPDRSDGRFWSTGLVGALHGFDGAPWARRAGGLYHLLRCRMTCAAIVRCQRMTAQPMPRLVWIRRWRKLAWRLCKTCPFGQNFRPFQSKWRKQRSCRKRCRKALVNSQAGPRG